MRAWIDVAVLAKPKNLDGRLVVRGTAGLPFLLEEGDRVALVPPKLDVPRAVTVSHVVLLDDDRAEISFEEVGDAQVANELVGMHCLIKRDLIDAESFEEAPALWEGWPVLDDSLGEIGILTGVVENTAQTLLGNEEEFTFWFGFFLDLLDNLTDNLVASVQAEIDKLPQDENGQAIAASIAEGNSWLQMLLHEVPGNTVTGGNG